MTDPGRTDTLIEATLVAASLLLASLLSSTLLHRAEPGTPVALLFELAPLPFFAFSLVWLVRRGRACDARRQR